MAAAAADGKRVRCKRGHGMKSSKPKDYSSTARGT
jgi:hypothetical protein